MFRGGGGFNSCARVSGGGEWQWVMWWVMSGTVVVVGYAVVKIFCSPGASSTLNYSPGPSIPPSYSPTFNISKLFSKTIKKCRVLKLQALAWKDNGTQGNSGNVYAPVAYDYQSKASLVFLQVVEMYMHPVQYTLNSAALLHEVYNDMGKLGLE
ncbi:hypothetical protein Tco_0252345, partial [Tanacetum coccineum]